MQLHSMEERGRGGEDTGKERRKGRGIGEGKGIIFIFILIMIDRRNT